MLQCPIIITVIKLNNQERDVCRILDKFGMRYPVKLSYATVAGTTDVPYIKPSDFITSMAHTNDLCRLLSGYSTVKEAKNLLKEFWRRYELVYPRHELFGVKGAHLPKERCLPLFIHGDEGTTYKKSAVLLISIQSCIGYGSRHRSLNQALTDFEKDMEKAGIPVNFLRTGLQSRFLCALTPKARFGDVYGGVPKTCAFNRFHLICTKDIPMSHFYLSYVAPFLKDSYRDLDHYADAWKDLISLIVDDLAAAQQHGINLPGDGLVYPIVLGNKGDWSWLVPGQGYVAKVLF